MTLTWTDLITLDLAKLDEAATEWKTAAEELAKLHGTVRDGLVKKSEAARWEGVNATVTREFVRSAAKEVDDLHREAKSIHAVLTDAHAELAQIQKRAKELADEARRGDPSHRPEPDQGLLVSDGGGGKVRVEPSICEVKGPNQRTKDMVRWYAETLTGLVSHAAEVDAAVTRALRASHGADPYNAGHAEYTSLDQDQLPRAMKLAALGGDAKPAQQAELRRLWQSLSPDARAQLWTAHRNDLLAAGLFNPSVKQVAPDRGSGKHGADDINVWDRYNWDEGKGVTIGDSKVFKGFSIPDGEPAQQHKVGLAQEFNMAGSSSVKHHELGGGTEWPSPDDPGRAGERSDPGRHGRDGGGDVDR
ncbi:hypothetical protein ACFVGY_29365 [Streptomyces sp. NPDC127106]|uniref:hypothetical protein n=1 Tax=Streptomyces sp. NPDC127106 TaxID=3345360 RepID=UPI00363AE243